jgi:hypothetical protein
MTQAQLTGIKSRIYVHATESADAKTLAAGNVKLFIEDNSAADTDGGTIQGAGGGIYFNGILTIGDSSLKNISAKKVWNSNDNPDFAKIPTSANFNLMRVSADGTELKIANFDLTPANSWAANYANLPSEFSYKLVETNIPSGWTASYSAATDGAKPLENIILTATNTAPSPKPNVPVVSIVPAAPSTGFRE